MPQMDMTVPANSQQQFLRQTKPMQPVIRGPIPSPRISNTSHYDINSTLPSPRLVGDINQTLPASRRNSTLGLNTNNSSYQVTRQDSIRSYSVASPRCSVSTPSQYREVPSPRAQVPYRDYGSGQVSLLGSQHSDVKQSPRLQFSHVEISTYYRSRWWYMQNRDKIQKQLPASRQEPNLIVQSVSPPSEIDEEDTMVKEEVVEKNNCESKQQKETYDDTRSYQRREARECLRAEELPESLATPRNRQRELVSFGLSTASSETTLQTYSEATLQSYEEMKTPQESVTPPLQMCEELKNSPVDHILETDFSIQLDAHRIGNERVESNRIQRLETLEELERKEDSSEKIVREDKVFLEKHEGNEKLSCVEDSQKLDISPERHVEQQGDQGEEILADNPDISPERHIECDTMKSKTATYGLDKSEENSSELGLENMTTKRKHSIELLDLVGLSSLEPTSEYRNSENALCDEPSVLVERKLSGSDLRKTPHAVLMDRVKSTKELRLDLTVGARNETIIKKEGPAPISPNVPVCDDGRKLPTPFWPKVRGWKKKNNLDDEAVKTPEIPIISSSEKEKPLWNSGDRVEIFVKKGSNDGRWKAGYIFEVAMEKNMVIQKGGHWFRHPACWVRHATDEFKEDCSESSCSGLECFEQNSGSPSNSSKCGSVDTGSVSNTPSASKSDNNGSHSETEQSGGSRSKGSNINTGSRSKCTGSRSNSVRDSGCSGSSSGENPDTESDSEASPIKLLRKMRKTDNGSDYWSNSEEEAPLKTPSPARISRKDDPILYRRKERDEKSRRAINEVTFESVREAGKELARWERFRRHTLGKAKGVVKRALQSTKGDQRDDKSYEKPYEKPYKHEVDASRSTDASRSDERSMSKNSDGTETFRDVRAAVSIYEGKVALRNKTRSSTDSASQLWKELFQVASKFDLDEWRRQL